MTEAASADISPFERIGGEAAVRRLAGRFYEIMAERPDAARIRAMHKDDLGRVAESLAGFLSGWMGGPRDWFEREDTPCIMGIHRALPIGGVERDQWIACMRQATTETVESDELRTLLDDAFFKLATAMRSS